MSKYVDANIFLNPVLYKDGKAEKCREILRQITGFKNILASTYLLIVFFHYHFFNSLATSFNFRDIKEIFKKIFGSLFCFHNYAIFLNLEDNFTFKIQKFPDISWNYYLPFLSNRSLHYHAFIM